MTAVEQPVGLQLDLSKGLVLGSQLVTNGTFVTDTAWTKEAGWSITGGKAVFNGTANKGLIQNIGLTANAVGSVTIVVDSVTSGGVSIQFGFNTATAAITTPGTYTYTLSAGAFPSIYIVSVGTAQFVISSVSAKLVAGNHRFQTTSANRPVVSARVNLLTKTEQFQDTGVWPQNGTVVVTPNANTAPDGTVTADLLDHTGGFSGVFQTIASVPAAVTYRASIAYKYIDGQVDLRFRPQGTSAPVGVDLIVNTQNNSVISSSGVSNVIFTPQDQGYTRVSFDVTTATSGSLTLVLYRASGGQARNYVWGADLRPTNQGVGLPAYQRVNTSTDYDSTGFPIYIKPNGSNQWMQTNSINFTATDKMTVWQGVRKLSDAAPGVFIELSANVGSNSGSFSMASPRVSGEASVVSDLRGTSGAFRYFTGVASPLSLVLTNQYDIAGATVAEELISRLNGVVQTGVSGGPAGTGNFGNYPAYFYARAGTSIFFNGHDYGSIARGAASTAAQITAGETYINSKTKAF